MLLLFPTHTPNYVRLKMDKDTIETFEAQKVVNDGVLSSLQAIDKELQRLSSETARLGILIANNRKSIDRFPVYTEGQKV